MSDLRRTRTHEDREALTESGANRNGLESLDAPPPRSVQQIQAATGPGPQNQATSCTDPHDIDD